LRSSLAARLIVTIPPSLDFRILEWTSAARRVGGGNNSGENEDDTLYSIDWSERIPSDGDVRADAICLAAPEM
jgi:hypothetical protein